MVIKKNKKKFIIIATIVAIISVCYLINMVIYPKNKNAQATAMTEGNADFPNDSNIEDESNSNEDLINIRECTEEFMNNYFEELRNAKDKENMLIITSNSKISNVYGASKIIESPNNQYVLQYDSEEDKSKAFELLKNDESIINVEENFAYTIESYNSWGIEKMALDDAIEVANGKELSEVAVAIIDTGCNMQLFNASFSGKIVETYNVLDPEDSMTDENGHGTHIAGTIAEGTPSNVKIIPIKVSSDGMIYNTDVITAINYIVHYNKANVINMSFGSYTSSYSVRQAIDSAYNANIICVCAAGNENTSKYSYPAGYTNTLSISACNSSLKRASFSNYGTTITFTAPGVGISSINGVMSGTSMAAPHASAAVAVLKSYNTNFTFDDIVQILKTYAMDLGDEGKDNYYGYGFIDFSEVRYCSCGCENCNGIYCSNCNCSSCIFHNGNTTVQRIEVTNPTILNYNYGSITNLSNIQLNIYYDAENYVAKYLYELDDYEIRNYNPYSYANQTITIVYNGMETSFELCQSEQESGWEYELINETSIRLKAYKEGFYANGNSINKIYIPEQIDGYSVASLGEELFMDSVLKDVTLPSSVSEICAKAFYNSSLVNIDIQASEVAIGDYAFQNLKRIQTINANINMVGAYAFEGCSMLNSISLSSTINEIGDGAFKDCIGIESITLPNNLTTIGSYAFKNCSNLTTITISKNVASIGTEAFCGCIGLEKITVDRRNSKYDSRSNSNALIETATNTLIASSQDTEIPSTVEVIGRYAFAYNISLAGIEIPDGVKEIQDYAFYKGYYMENILVPASVETIGNNAFGGMSGITLWVYRGSYARTYAKAKGIKYSYIDPSTEVDKVVVNGEEIAPDAPGTYSAEILGGSTSTTLKVVAVDDTAKIKITKPSGASVATSKAELTTTVQLPDDENEYIITIIDQDENQEQYTVKISKQTNIVGHINLGSGLGKAMVTVYESIDEVSNETNSPRIITQFELQEDGTFTISIDDIEKYDILITKPGYLSYMVKGIEVEKANKTELEEYSMIAGDVVDNDEIEIDDLVVINNNCGTVITEENKVEKGIYDLNGDGIINRVDANILKANYGKKAETVVWVQ